MRTGDSTAELADPTSAAYGMAVLLGIVNDDFRTDQFDKKETRFHKGSPQVRPSWSVITALMQATAIARHAS